MAGIFPSNGVAATSTVNGVDVATVNCTNELFYSVQRCQPRFDPAAMNAVISEILNAVAGAGLSYNCNILNNLFLAMQEMSGANLTLVRTPTENIIESDAGTDATLVLADGTDAGLMPPLSGDPDHYLAGDGEWRDIDGSGGGSQWPTGFTRLFIIKRPGSNGNGPFVIPAGETHILVNLPAYDGTAAAYQHPRSKVIPVVPGDSITFDLPPGAGVNITDILVNGAVQGAGIVANIMGAYIGNAFDEVAATGEGATPVSNAARLNAPNAAADDLPGFVYLRQLA